jgi:hypothetical protein
MMRDERPDADHMRFKLFYEYQIINDMVRGLKRRTDHEPAAHLVAYPLQVIKALFSVPERHPGWMQPSIMFFISCFMAQQVSVCAGLKESLI